VEEKEEKEGKEEKVVERRTNLFDIFLRKKGAESLDQEALSGPLIPSPHFQELIIPLPKW